MRPRKQFPQRVRWLIAGALTIAILAAIAVLVNYSWLPREARGAIRSYGEQRGWDISNIGGGGVVSADGCYVVGVETDGPKDTQWVAVKEISGAWTVVMESDDHFHFDRDDPSFDKVCAPAGGPAPHRAPSRMVAK